MGFLTDIGKNIQDYFSSVQKRYNTPTKVAFQQTPQNKAFGQGIVDLPASFKILAQRAPGAINTMVMNPQEAGNLARTTPNYAQVKVPGMQTAANFAANSGQTFGQGLQNMAMGVNRVQKSKGVLNKTAGVFQTIGGAGQTLSPFTAWNQVPNFISSLPQTNIPVANQAQRFSAGVVRGMAADPTLAPNIKNKNLIDTNIMGQDIKIDPFETAGSMIGFIKNPVNNALFKTTEKILPVGNILNKGTNIKLWLATNGFRGSIEQLFTSMGQMPENATDQEKAMFMLQNIGVGAGTEIGGRALSDMGSKAINTIANSKLAVNAFDELKDWTRKLNTPIATNKFDKNGERIIEPAWRATLKSQEGKISFGAKVGKNDVAQPGNIQYPLETTGQYNGKPYYQLSPTEEINAVKEGYKPIAINFVPSVNAIKTVGTNGSTEYIHFNPSNPDSINRANQLDALMRSVLNNGHTIETETKMGQLLGYPKSGIDKYIQDIYINNVGPRFDPQTGKPITSQSPPSTPPVTDIANARNIGQEPTVPKLSQQNILSSETSVPQAFNAEATPSTLGKVRIRDINAEAKTARQDFAEWSKAVRQQETPRTTTGAINDATRAIKTNTVSPVAKDVSTYKDISGFNGQARDVYRNFKQVFGDKYETVKRTVLDPFDRSKGVFTKNLETHANELDNNIVKKYGFNKGSKESAAIQEYGEGTKTFDQLVKEFGDKKAKNIVEADKWFRKQYDTLLSEVNATRKKIYPNDPTKIIPRRSDYYRHFKDMQEGFSGLANIFDSPANIQSGLAGVSSRTKPKSKWLSFAQKRLGGNTEVDAIGGFINYVKSAEYAKNIDPHTATFRALREELAKATDLGTPQAGKLNNFIEFLDSYANDLAGKTSDLDRFVQTVIPGGRKAMSAINWINNRVKANVILGNASSSLAQIMNVPQGIANAGPIASTKGLGRTIASIFDSNKIIKQSDFIAERYSGGTFNRFDRGMISNTKKMAVWMIQALDEVGTKYIWNSHYELALSKGISNPIKYADDFTREMVAGRGIGEVPLIQKSKVFQLVAPFQLEVGNLWHVLGGFVGERAFGKIATFLVASYVFNRGIEKIRGNDVSLDPIQASLEAYQTFKDEENKGLGLTKAGGRLAGEVLSNVPFGQSLASVYPEYGFKVGDTQAPTRKDLFGKGDPTRFGSGLLAMKGLQDPLFKVLPPFGGQQLERTLQGVDAVNKGASESQSGRVQYPIEQTPGNYLQAGVFGKYSTPEAKDYFNNDRTPLGDKQSETFNSLGGQDAKNYYNDVMQKRELSNQVSKEKDVKGASAVSIKGLNADQIKAKEDVASARVKLNGGSIWVGDKLIYGSNGESSSIDLSPPTKGTGIGAFANQNWNITKARTVWNEDGIDVKTKQEAFKRLGVKAEDVRYDALANYSNDIKTQYIISKSPDHDTLLDNLLTGRKRSIGDNIFASDGVITELVNQGLITKDEGKKLKALDYNKDGTLKATSGSGKKGKKVSIVKTSPVTVSSTPLKFSKPTPFKFAPPPTFKLTSSPAKLAKFQVSGIKTKFSSKPSLTG